MKKMKVFLIFFLLMFSGFIAAQNFTAPITVTDGANSQVLAIGVHPNGSDGFDSGLDELAPPPPPGGAFDARIKGSGALDYLKEIRANSPGEKQFRFSYAAETGQGPILLTWDSASLGVLGTFTIVDDITGALFGPLDMTTTDSLEITDPLIAAGLRILVTPFAAPNQPPVLDSIPDQSMTAGDTLEVPVSASDPEAGNITLSANNLPSFGAFTDNADGSGVFSFTPAPGDSGFFSAIQVIATDDSSAADTVYFNLTVEAAPLVLNPPQNLSATPGDEVVHLTWAAPAAASQAGIDRLAGVRDLRALEKIPAQNLNPRPAASKALLRYRIYRADDGVNFSVIDSLDAPTTLYDDNSVNNQTTYSYYVTAVYDEGESDPSNTVSATPNSGGTTIVYEEIFADSLPPGGWIVEDVDGSGSAWEFIQEDPLGLVEPQAGISFWWSNFNNANEFLINEYLISPQIPAADFTQLSFYATAIGGDFDDSLRVWISTTGNAVPDFTNLIGHIRVDGPAVDWKKYVFDITSFSGQAIYVAINYYHENGGPAGDHSDNVWFDHVQIVAGGFILDAPLNLTASAGDGEVDLAWTAPVGLGTSATGGAFDIARGLEIPPTEKNSSSIATTLTGFNIYRSEDNVNFAKLDSVEAAATAYTDFTVINDVTYYYFVTAVYDRGESAASDTVSATPAASDLGILYEEIFPDTIPPAGWIVIDNDGSGEAWSFRQLLNFGPGQLVFPQAGASFWFSNFNNANDFLIDEYLVTPQIQRAIFDSLYFYAGAIDGQFKDSLRVWVSTTGNNLEDFTHLIGHFKVDGPLGNWTRYGFDLSPFSGKDIYIALNYYHTDGGPSGANSDNIWLDHVIVTGTPEDSLYSEIFYAQLNGYQEVPPNASPGSGDGIFFLSKDSTELAYEVAIRNLSGEVTAAHFHRGAAGSNGLVVFTIFGGGTVGGDTTFSGVWNAGSSEPLTPELVEALINGNIYVNVHTVNVASGEIRGQVVLNANVELLPPQNLSAAPGPGSAELAWGTPDSSANFYNIYRAEGSGEFAFFDTTAHTAYSDTSITAGQTYFYFVTAIYHEGQSIPTDTVSTVISGINTSGELPGEFALEQNYPNPFNPATTLKYALKENAGVTLKIYNNLGQLVRTLVNEKQTAGFKEVVWDGVDDRGVKVASGIYLYHLDVTPGFGSQFITTKKMILLK